MRRSLGLASVLVAVSLMFPLGASAGPPGARIPPGTVFVDAPPGLVCPEATGEVTWTFVDGQYSVVDKPGGRMMQGMGTGQIEVRGVDTGKSLVVQLSGATSYSPPGEDGTFVVHTAGKVIWGFWPGDDGPGDPSSGRTYLFVGSTTSLLAADSVGLDFSYSGKILMDVCAAIS